MRQLLIILTVALLSSATAQQPFPTSTAPQPSSQPLYSLMFHQWVQQYALQAYLYQVWMLGGGHIGP